jgi:hypothetical protein
MSYHVVTQDGTFVWPSCEFGGRYCSDLALAKKMLLKYRMRNDDKRIYKLFRFVPLLKDGKIVGITNTFEEILGVNPKVQRTPKIYTAISDQTTN